MVQLIKKRILISVIISTYNWKEALEACLISLFAQSDLGFEIIIADDGSRPDTMLLVKQLSPQSPVPLKYVYHADKGFRVAAIRNKAVIKSDGDYLLFLDGDCVVFPNFIKRHRLLSAKGYFVPGNRILLSSQFTKAVLIKPIVLHKASILTFLKWRLQNKINRILPLFYWPFNLFRLLRPTYWKHAIGCNLAIWKYDFIAVNGFEQLFIGWGYEDSDLIIRLINNGVKRKDGRFAVPVLHLWHKHNDRSKQQQNYKLLMERVGNNKFIRAQNGISRCKVNASNFNHQ